METNLNDVKIEDSLDNFTGWDNAGDADFFSELDTNNDTDTDAEGVTPPVTDNDAQEDDKSESKAGADLFSELEENADIEESGLALDDAEGDDVKVNSNLTALNLLKEKGFIELEEDVELTEENAEEIFEDKFEEAIETRVQELFANMPDEIKKLNKFVMDGGNWADFVSTVSNQGNAQISEDIDLDNESNQELVLREMLRAEGNDNEEIETQLGYLKANGKLEVMAEKKFNKWLAEKKKTEQDLIARQNEAKKLEKEAIRESKKEVTNILKESEQIGDLPVSTKDVNVIPTYMNDKTVKLPNGGAITELQKELFYDLPKNKKAFTQLAILMKNRNEDGTFNFERIAKDVETKVTTKVKTNVRRSKNMTPSTSQSRSVNNRRPLADYF